MRRDCYAAIGRRSIVVTGAASGIGAAIARRFVEEGAAVAMLDRDARGLEAAAREAPSTVTLVADVAHPGQVGSAIEAAARMLQGIDGLVNAAGVLHLARFEDTELAQWQRMLDVNLSGPWIVCRAALPHLRRGIASGLALRPAASYSAYAASKAGLITLTRAPAIELAPAIRANVVCPGAVETPMTRDLYLDPQRKSEAMANYALGRLATTSEVANAALFLRSSDSSFTTWAPLRWTAAAHFTDAGLVIDAGLNLV